MQESPNNVEELLIRVLQGRASWNEQQWALDWRRVSAENEGLYRRLEGLWEMTAKQSPPVGTHPPSAQLIAKWAEARRERVAEEARTERLRSNRKVRFAMATAAVVILGLGLWSIVPGGESPSPVRVAELTTGPSEMLTARLEDGSFIRLGPSSSLRFGTDPGPREVWLEGRAFFAIAHQDGEPFTVQSRFGEAVVLGTRFEMGVGNDLRLLVVDGRVALTAAGERLEISAGEMSVASDQMKPSKVAVENIHSMLTWMGHSLIFQSTPLATVVPEVEARYGVDITLVDPSLADRTITASFTGLDFDDVLAVICRVAETECSLDGMSATIGGSPRYTPD